MASRRGPVGLHTGALRRVVGDVSDDRTGVTDAAPPRAGTFTLSVAGASSILNGVVHFLLPVYFPWSDRLEGMYAPLEWALFATTVFFGGLLVLGGLLTIVVVRARGVPRVLVVLAAGGMTLWWLLATVYEVIVPFPAPVASWLLPTISGAVAVLHVVGLWRHLAARRATPGG